ncbi:MAG: hypothetical protein V1887_03490 [Candidatus Aenigmatarchaeota archaeon]
MSIVLESVLGFFLAFFISVVVAASVFQMTDVPSMIFWGVITGIIAFFLLFLRML